MTVKVTFRTSEEVGQALLARGDEVGLIARRDLERYYGLLALRVPKLGLSDDEQEYLVQAIKGWRSDAQSYCLIWAVVDVYAERHPSAVTPDLIRKLRELDDADCLAVIDAVERYWRLPDSTPDRFRLVGFRS